jgi:hypothetical protein
MVLTRMVPYSYLTNATRLTTRLGFPVEVVVRCGGTARGVGGGGGAARRGSLQGCLSASAQAAAATAFRCLLTALRRPRTCSLDPPKPSRPHNQNQNSADGNTKWLKSGASLAKIVRPDDGRPMVPAVVLMVDAFLLPLNYTDLPKGLSLSG